MAVVERRYGIESGNVVRVAVERGFGRLAVSIGKRIPLLVLVLARLLAPVAESMALPMSGCAFLPFPETLIVPVPVLPEPPLLALGMLLGHNRAQGPLSVHRCGYAGSDPKPFAHAVPISYSVVDLLDASR